MRCYDDMFGVIQGDLLDQYMICYDVMFGVIQGDLLDQYMRCYDVMFGVIRGDLESHEQHYRLMVKACVLPICDSVAS